MSVCIVGNSANLLSEESGKIIDSCEIVIRIQKFRTKGLEKNVGSKTSIVSFAWCSPEKIKDWINYADIQMDKVILWSVFPLVGRRFNCAMEILGHADIPQPDNQMYNRLIKNLYSDFWIKKPSSGITTIEMAMKYFPDHKIYICGFDNKIEKDHYYDATHIDKLDPGMTVSGHNWEKEWHYIQDLLKNEKIFHIQEKK